MPKPPRTKKATHDIYYIKQDIMYKIIGATSKQTCGWPRKARGTVRLEIIYSGHAQLCGREMTTMRECSQCGTMYKTLYLNIVLVDTNPIWYLSNSIKLF